MRRSDEEGRLKNFITSDTRRAIETTYHTELELIAESLARQILKERPQIRELMGQLIEAELRASLKSLGESKISGAK